MAEPITPQFPTPLDEGFLAKTHETYRLHNLAPEHLELALDMQQRAADALGSDRYFLVPRSRAQLFSYLRGWPLDSMHGLTVDDAYAGQIIVRLKVLPREHARNIAAINDLHSYAIVQGALTNPDLRGRGLLQIMLQFVTDTLFPSLPVDLLIARVVPENLPSWRVFLKAGFRIIAAEPDPEDERRVFYMGYNFAPHLGETRLIEATDYNGIQALCRAGWHGIAYDDASQLLTFQK